MQHGWIYGRGDRPEKEGRALSKRERRTEIGRRLSTQFDRREFLRASGIVAATALAGIPAQSQSKTGKPGLNVLFIMVDDLRPELGCYGRDLIQTPNIDNLARKGIVFDRAYCQQAICNPSRSSLLTGLRPETLRVLDLDTHFRKTLPFIKTLPQYFKRNGYRTVRIGKIFHDVLPDPPSWSIAEPDIDSGCIYQSPETRQKIKDIQAIGKMYGRSNTWQQTVLRGPVDEAWEGSEDGYYDTLITQHALSQLKKLKDTGPFFLALGYYKPHLPYNVPKRFWDLYNRDELPLPAYRQPPKNAPSFSLNENYELACYEEFTAVRLPGAGGLTEQEIRRLKHGYYASVSFVDEQIGRVLKGLDELGLRDSTMVVLLGDHGTKLGEYGAWGKRTSYETDLHAPLIVSAPGGKQGLHTSALVEFVDIYPTICELAGLKVPDNLEGQSMVPLLTEPQRPWKTAAFSLGLMGFARRFIGRSMRTDRYRLIQWGDLFTGRHIGYELYDHQTDPGETDNIASVSTSKDLIQRLSSQLAAGWKAARPKMPGALSTLP